MNEYDDLVNDFTSAAPAKAITSLGENPDDGARSLALSRSTGVAPEVIHADLDGFEQEHRQRLTNGIVRNNDYIAAYIRGNKLADVVSNDDYGNLDNVSNVSQRLSEAIDQSKKFIQYLPGFQILKAGVESFEQPMLRTQDVSQDGLAGALVRSADVIAKSGRAIMAAPMVGPVNWVEKVVHDMTGDANLAGRISREFAGIIESEMGRGGSGIPHDVSNLNTYLMSLPREQRGPALEQITKWKEAATAAEPWTKAGLEPPRGLHPLIDELKVKGNEENIARIDEVLAKAQESLTKERDPQLFENFIEQHVEDSTIGISADRIVALYGDRIPEAGDNLFGWLPGIADKLEAARTFGEDVHIPLKDWLTRVDPALARDLSDDLRTWPGAITKNEAAAAKEASKPIDRPATDERSLDERIDAFGIEHSEMADDSTRDARGFRIGGLKDSLDVASSISGVSGERGINAINIALRNNRPDIALAIVERAERTAERSDTTPTVSESNPKYNEIKADLERRKEESTAYAKQLRDLYNEGSKNTPHQVIDAPLPQVRDAISTEPMFSLGDRKLTLQPQKNKYEGKGPRQLAEANGLVWDDMTAYERQAYIDATNPEVQGPQHSYDMIDQAGRPVGSLLLTPDPVTKQLYVDWIGGLGVHGPSSFGPSLIRNLKRQLKELYPDYETVTGHRVSGARYKDGEGAKNPTDHPVVKLHIDDLARDDAAMRQMLNNAYMRQFDHGVEGLIIPKVEYAREEQRLIAAMQEEAARVAPGVEVIPTAGVAHPKGAGATGVFLRGLRPQILVDMFSPDAKHVMRHEFMHYMRDILRPEEWAALENAAKSEGWIKRYNIEERYGDILKDRPELMLEESIAEAYPDWHRVKDSIEQPKTLVTQAFQKIYDFIQRVKQRFAEILGREPTFDELFEKISSGEIGQRSLKDRMNGVQSEPMASVGERMDNLRAEAAGLDSKSFKKMQELIKQRHEEDLQAAIKQAEKEQAATQTKEWKDNAREIRKQVDKDIRQRPDVAADLLVGSGELQGQKLKQRYPLRAEDLTDLQKSMLPRHYYSKEGLPVDGVAQMFGFHSGDAMVDKLIEYRLGREDMTSQERLADTIKTETNRRMEAEYGKLQDNIQLDAMDQALSETNLNLLAEEWQSAAMKAGVATVDKDVAKSAALEMFGKMKLGEVSLDRMIAGMGRFGRDAERKLIAGDNAGALVDMQRKYMTGLLAAEMRKLQKEQAAFDRTAKQFSKREVPSVDPEYTNYVHDILMRVGKPVRRSIQDLAASIEAGTSKNLPDFVADKSLQLREVPVWDQLFDQAWRKDLKELSVDEFRAVHDSIKTLVHNGRDEMKLTRAGEAEDFAAIKEQMINAVAASANNEIREPKQRGAVRKLPMQYYVGHLQMENILGRWDDFDSKGVWTQYVMRDLIDGANQVDAWKKEYAEKIKKLETPQGLGRTVENLIFKDQDTGTLIPFSRKNLIAVMLNTGNDSNLVKMAKGYGLEPRQVMDWVHEHATPGDWKFVQGIWDTFADIKKKSDTMYRSLTGGVAPENIVTRPVIDATGAKVAEGGYYPVIFHPEMEGSSKKLMGPNALEEQNYVRATTPAGYTKSRTGYVAPLALDLDAMPGRMSQMLHDIGLRPAVLNASKVFYDKDIRSAVRKFYGEEYRETLIPYLRGVANASNYMDKNQKALARASEFIRQNMITTLVGFNPGTVMKHGPTAAVLSAKEVGPVNFANAVRGMFSINEQTGDSNWAFAIKNSLELRRRDRNWQETLYGATSGLTPGEKFEPWRQKIMEWSSKPVALSDMISAVPTWLAKYRQEMEAGASHGDAVFEADRSVRRAHGSTAATNRTSMQRNVSPWMTSIYNFWSEIMNRQMESIWRAGRGIDAVKEGDRAKAMEQGKYMIGAAFAFVIWPAIVENYVSPHPHKEDDSWAKKAGTQLMYTLGSSWVGIRDIATGLSFGRDPQFGLTGTTYQTVSNLWRDFNKPGMFSSENRGKLLQDGATLMGAMTGMVPAQVGKVARFGHDISTGKENPRSAWQWLVGLRYGTTDEHSQSFDQYMRGH